MALAFIAFFGVVVVAVLRVAEVPGLQHGRTETTAVQDAKAEGGAAYAAADSGRTDLALTCAVNNTGQLTMQNGDIASYLVKTCNPGQTAGTSGPGPGANCVLCILNLNPSPTSPGANVLDLHCAQCNPDVTTTGGDVYVNGSMGRGRLTANPSGAHIRFLSGATFPSSGLSPTPTYYSPAISNPLAIAAPSVTNQPLLCPNGNWDSSNGCSLSFNSGVSTVSPGLWSTLSVSGSAKVTLLPGVYVFTGGISATGNNATIDAPLNVTMFLTCPGYGSIASGRLCLSPGPGGNINLNGKGVVTISAPTTGTYAGISIFADPKLTGTVLSSGGKGGLTANTTDVPSGDVSMQGNGGMSISGRLIVNSLTMSVSGNASSGLSLSGTTGVSTSSCGVFDASVTGASGSNSSTGRAVVQSQCGTGSVSGVVAFNYKQ